MPLPLTMRRVVLALVVLMLVGAGRVEAAVYLVTDLGDLLGGEDYDHPTAVSGTGQVFGVGGTADGDRASRPGCSAERAGTADSCQ